MVCDQQKRVLLLIVANGGGPTLLGRNWPKELKLNWHSIFLVNKTKTLSGLGTIKGFKADIKLQDGAKPVFSKAQPVPCALRQKVQEELDCLESQVVIKKVERSDWALPIIYVPKRDGSIRICGDFKVSINKVLLHNPYPLPDTGCIRHFGRWNCVQQD